MKITDLVKEAHDNAVAKGFYPESEEKIIGELLMLIVSELGEALEAHRCGRKADWQNYTWQIEKSGLDSIKSFELNIKDTFEDEIADTVIRIADLCGYLGIELSLRDRKFEFSKNIPEELFEITTGICLVGYSELLMSQDLSNVVSRIFAFCESLGIDIKKHIRAKLEYNKKRPYKHGKNY